MRALTYSHYGPPDVVGIEDVPKPEIGPNDVLVRVMASGVNTGDWRVRAADFPGIMVVPGRLMFGLTKPRNRRLGTEFAGTIAAVGTDTTRFAVGDRVFGFSAKGGASAEYLAIDQDAAIAPMSSTLSFEEAAALPFGGLAALAFLTDFGALTADQDVLIVGASGGVGVYAVQIAKAFGARVPSVPIIVRHSTG
jgi:NADPH:quinone reductase-like Zn-dependent oxidoreductase